MSSTQDGSAGDDEVTPSQSQIPPATSVAMSSVNVVGEPINQVFPFSCTCFCHFRFTFSFLTNFHYKIITICIEMDIIITYVDNYCCIIN
jgi:hypothetical protein